METNANPELEGNQEERPKKEFFLLRIGKKLLPSKAEFETNLPKAILKSVLFTGFLLVLLFFIFKTVKMLYIWGLACLFLYILAKIFKNPTVKTAINETEEDRKSYENYLLIEEQNRRNNQNSEIFGNL